METWTPAKSKKGFITNTATQKTVRFQYNPESLDVSTEGAWEDADNRNIVPHQEWKGGKEPLAFQIRFKRTPGYDISKAVVALRSFAKPTMKNGKFQEPATCIVKIGSGSWKVKIRKVITTYTAWTAEGIAKHIDVTIECTSWNNVPKPPEEKKESKAAAAKPKKPDPKENNRPYSYLVKGNDKRPPGSTGSGRNLE